MISHAFHINTSSSIKLFFHNQKVRVISFSSSDDSQGFQSNHGFLLGMVLIADVRLNRINAFVWLNFKMLITDNDTFSKPSVFSYSSPTQPWCCFSSSSSHISFLFIETTHSVEQTRSILAADLSHQQILNQMQWNLEYYRRSE